MQAFLKPHVKQRFRHCMHTLLLGPFLLGRILLDVKGALVLFNFALPRIVSLSKTEI
jgi:hypothetical protein